MAKSVYSLIFRGKDQTRETFDSIERNVRRTTDAVAALTAVTGIAFLGGAIRSSKEFEEQLKRVQAVSGATGQGLDSLRSIAEQLGATTRFTATQAAEGLEELTRAGQSVEDAIATIPNALSLAQANAIELADAAQLVTTTLNQYSLAAGESTRVSDVLTRTTQLSAQNIEQLGNALEFAGPQAKLTNLSLEETTAIIGKLADVGFRGEKGGTALRNALIELSDPSSKFSETLKDLGITSDNFVDVLVELEARGDGAKQAFLDLGKRAGPAIAKLVDSGTGDLRRLIEELRNANGTAARTAEQMDDNLSGALKGLESAFDALRRAVADPVLESLTSEVQDLSQEMRDLVQNGDAEKIGRTITTVFTESAGAVRFLRQEFAALKVVAAAVLGIFITLAGRVTKLTTLIIAGAAAIVTYRNEIANLIDKMADWVASQERVGFTLNPLKNSLTILGVDAKGVASEIRGLATRFRDASAAGESLNQAIRQGTSGISRVLGLIGKGAEIVRRYATQLEGASDATVDLGDSQGDAAGEVDEFTKKVDGLIDGLFEYDNQLALLKAAQDAVNERFRSKDPATYLFLINELDAMIAELTGSVDTNTQALDFNVEALNQSKLATEELRQAASLFRNDWEEAAVSVGDALALLPPKLQVILDTLGRFGGLDIGRLLSPTFLDQFNPFGLFAQTPADGVGPPTPGSGFFGNTTFGQAVGGAFQGAGIGTAIGGFIGPGAQEGGGIGGAIGGAIGSAFGPIGTLVGSFLGGALGGLIDGADNPESEIVFGSFSERAGSDNAIRSALGDVFVRSGVDGFRRQLQPQVTDAVSGLLETLGQFLDGDQLDAARSALGNTRLRIDADSVANGEFLSDIFDIVSGALDSRVQSLVGPFDRIKDQLRALEAATAFVAELDRDALADYNEAVRQASRTQTEMLSDQLGGVQEFLQEFDGTIAEMQQGAGLLNQFNNAVIQTIAALDRASDNVKLITANTIEQLEFSALTEPQQSEFLIRRAQQLAGQFGGLNSAEDVQAQIQRINDLVLRFANGLDRDSLLEELPFLRQFLESAEQTAQVRIAELRAETEAINDLFQTATSQFSDAVSQLQGAATSIDAGGRNVGDAGIQFQKVAQLFGGHVERFGKGTVVVVVDAQGREIGAARIGGR